jgi:hypothetical protein
MMLPLNELFRSSHWRINDEVRSSEWKKKSKMVESTLIAQ